MLERLWTRINNPCWYMSSQNLYFLLSSCYVTPCLSLQNTNKMNWEVHWTVLPKFISYSLIRFFANTYFSCSFKIENKFDALVQQRPEGSCRDLQYSSYKVQYKCCQSCLFDIFNIVKCHRTLTFSIANWTEISMSTIQSQRWIMKVLVNN